jgi:methyl-accepting chemotaxis protein
MFERLANITIIIKNLAIAGFFCVLTFTSLSILDSVRSLQTTVQQTTQQITQEIPKLRRDIFSTIDTNILRIDRRISSIERNLFIRVDSIENNAFNRIDALNRNLDTLTQESLALSASYRSIPTELTKSLTVVNARMDCKYNDSCWPNLFSDVLIDSRNMVRTGSKSFLLINKEIPKATNEISKVSTSLSIGIPKIVDNTTRITSNIDRLTKPKWYDRILGVGANASLIYFNVSKVR